MRRGEAIANKFTWEPGERCSCPSTPPWCRGPGSRRRQGEEPPPAGGGTPARAAGAVSRGAGGPATGLYWSPGTRSRWREQSCVNNPRPSRRNPARSRGRGGQEQREERPRWRCRRWRRQWHTRTGPGSSTASVGREWMAGETVRRYVIQLNISLQISHISHLTDLTRSNLISPPVSARTSPTTQCQSWVSAGQPWPASDFLPGAVVNHHHHHHGTTMAPLHTPTTTTHMTAYTAEFYNFFRGNIIKQIPLFI